ncbi:MAG: hypothetical protein KDD47_20510 [Acidobacteria bacterium]|nr:hypothetical protein [Acidobacteriota bacterium]
MNRPARTHRRGPERVLWAAWLTLLLSLPAVAQDEPNGGNDIPTCDGGGTSPITLTWLEAPTPDASSRLSGTTANLLLTNGTREDLEAQVVLDLDRGGESFQLTLPTVSVLAGSRQTLAVDLAAGGRDLPDDSTSFAGAHAYLVRNDRGTVSQAAAAPLAFYREGAGGLVVLGSAELRRRLASRETPEGRLLDSEEPDPETELEMAFQIDGSRHRKAPPTFDLEGALATEEELARNRKSDPDEETQR